MGDLAQPSLEHTDLDTGPVTQAIDVHVRTIERLETELKDLRLELGRQTQHERDRLLARAMDTLDNIGPTLVSHKLVDVDETLSRVWADLRQLQLMKD